MGRSMTAPLLRLSLVDMNNGVVNEATRCFRRIFDAFQNKVRAANPGIEIRLQHVQPRNLGELPDRDADLVMSSGGPGSPHDGWDEPWCTGYRHFLDHVMDRATQAPATAPGLFVVCHSFEIAVQHFGLAEMRKRESLKFGVMPAYVTEAGRASSLLEPFEDRLFVWEHRSYEAVNLDEKRLAALGGELWAVESRPGGEVDKGDGLLAFRLGPGIVGTQFHPEADRPGVLAWIKRPQHAQNVVDTYGEDLYERMIRTLEDPTRLARTYALLLPTWLMQRFNELARFRGLNPIAAPEQDMRAFEDTQAAAG